MKSSGELSSVPYPTTVSIPFTLFRLLLGWSVDLQPWVARHFQEDTPLRVRESLSSHDCDIYRGYALIRQESTLLSSRTPELAPRDGSISFLLSVWRPSSLWTSASTAPSVSPPSDSVFFRRKKFLQGMRFAIADKLLSRSFSSRDYSDVFNFFHLLALLFSSYFVAFFFETYFFKA